MTTSISKVTKTNQTFGENDKPVYKCYVRLYSEMIFTYGRWQTVDIPYEYVKEIETLVDVKCYYVSNLIQTKYSQIDACIYGDKLNLRDNSMRNHHVNVLEYFYTKKDDPVE